MTSTTSVWYTCLERVDDMVVFDGRRNLRARIDVFDPWMLERLGGSKFLGGEENVGRGNEY